MNKSALALGSVFTIAVATTPVYAEEVPATETSEEAVEEVKGMSEAAPEEVIEEAESEETKGMSEEEPSEEEAEEVE